MPSAGSNQPPWHGRNELVIAPFATGFLRRDLRHLSSGTAASDNPDKGTEQ